MSFHLSNSVATECYSSLVEKWFSIGIFDAKVPTLMLCRFYNLFRFLILLKLTPTAFQIDYMIYSSRKHHFLDSFGVLSCFLLLGEENPLQKASVCDMMKDEVPCCKPDGAPSSLSPNSASQPPLSLTKSGSEDSCGDTEGILSPEEGKVSSGDSEDEGRYSMDKSEEAPPVPEVIPISG